MSLETLLTLAVAVGILVLASILRLIVLGGVKLVRLATGRPQRRPERPIGEAVATRTVGERFRRVREGAGALAVFVVAVLATVVRSMWAGIVTGAQTAAAGGRAAWTQLSRWWTDAAQPSLEDARTASLALMTPEPETSGQVDVFERMTPVLSANGNGSHEEETAADMQLV